MNDYNKEIIERVSRVFLADDLIERSKNLECYYNGCRCKPIDSHSIQEALLKNTIGKSGHVSMTTVHSTAENIRQNSDEMFSNVTTTKSGVFQGFCGDIGGYSHDSILFKSIEIRAEIEKTTIKHYAFLYAYRALIYQMWLENILASKMNDDSFTKAAENPVVDENILRQVINIASESMELSEPLQKYNILKNYFEKYIKENGEICGDISDSFNIDVIELNDWKLEFAGIGAKFFPYARFPICYGLIPSQYNKPNLFFWVSAKGDSFTHSFLESILSQNQTFSIGNLIALSGNIMLSEELFQNLKSSKTGELDRLKEFIASDRKGKLYDHYDLIKNQGFRLFREFIN